MQGPVRNENVRGFKDMDARERLLLVPVIVLMFWLGIFPGTVLRKMDASVGQYLKILHKDVTALAVPKGLVTTQGLRGGPSRSAIVPPEERRK
jgi:NADH:ubiquinone oxidoreductase subunit 4 (subunit M)